MKGCGRGLRRTSLALVALAPWLVAAGAHAFEPQLAGMSIAVKDEVLPYRVFAIYVLPEEELGLSVVERGLRKAATLDATWGSFRLSRPGAWSGRTPLEGGVHHLSVVSGAHRIDLNVIVMVPASAARGGSLNGFRLGRYPSEPLRGLPAYRSPRGFVEVTPDNRETLVSPHFTLGQFLCKQAGGYPKYVVLRERLLLKLEQLLERANAAGHSAETFFVMSGFRTPSYNAAIGNVRYSRHQWGDAADVFIDESPRDGVMDDLDRNGRIDLADALVLYELFDRLSKRYAERGERLTGGLGLYGTTANHGPFVHVDTRGYRARWGR